LTSATRPKGFTLLEVMITLVILSVALLALAGLMVTTARNNASGGHVTEAVTFGQDKLEEFRATRWESLLPTTAGPRADQTQGCTGINYTRTWDIIQNGNFKTISVAINWNDRINHSIRLVSVAAQ
jgi:prepilin-type N-terminal cleavage/methylation domain-containing protein